MGNVICYTFRERGLGPDLYLLVSHDIKAVMSVNTELTKVMTAATSVIFAVCSSRLSFFIPMSLSSFR